MASDVVLKVVLCGACCTGKTMFFSRNITASYARTFGVQFGTRQIETGNRVVKLQVWDVAGDVRFRTIATIYLGGHSKVLLFFSVNDRGTLDEAINEWLPVLHSHDGDIVLVGTRMDDSTLRAVPQAEAASVASQYGMEYAELLLTDVEGFDTFLRDVVEGRSFPKPGCVRHPRPLVQELAGFGNIDARQHWPELEQAI